jgi:hypothetical protein
VGKWLNMNKENGRFQDRIPSRDDDQKGNGRSNDNGRSRFPSGNDKLRPGGGEVRPEGERKVFPTGIGGFDQGDLLVAGPVFEVLLAGDGVEYVLEVLVIDESVDLVTRCMRSRAGFAVSSDAFVETVSDSDVEGTGSAGEDVDPEIVLALHRGKDSSDGGEYKGESNGNGRSGFPSGMTSKRASAKAEADSLRE